MGRTYIYHCARCEYQARVSGGPDAGYHCVTQTIVCRDCRALHDVPVKLRVPEADAAPPPPKSLRLKMPARLPEKTDVTSLLLFGRPPRTKWVSLKLCCPVAAHHQVEAWAAPGKCPRCGTFLEQTVTPFRVWD